MNYCYVTKQNELKLGVMKIPMPKDLRDHNFDIFTKNDNQNTLFVDFLLLKMHVIDIVLQKVNLHLPYNLLQLKKSFEDKNMEEFFSTI
jgi:hypothetical protein